MATNRLIVERTGIAAAWAAPPLFPGALVLAVAIFMLAPGSLEHKAHLALHGLCAQRPSHTLGFDGQMLPFDARMTGIYGGFLLTSGYLLARGRYRAFALPGRSVLLLLGGFVAVMGIDGTNSLLVDLRLPHLYSPDNLMRLLTGMLTGTALAVILCFLLATTLWRQGAWHRAAVEGPRELALIVGLQVPFALLVASGWGPLFAPLTVALLLAALAVVTTMALVVLLIARRADRSYGDLGELDRSAVVALVIGIVAMAAISGGRVVLERMLGAPILT